MALMLGKLYEALRASGADDVKAREAAEEVAAYEAVISGLRTEVRVVQAVAGIAVVLLVTGIWQVTALRGEISEMRGEVRATLASIEARLPRQP
jgi:hypothetical protein